MTDPRIQAIRERHAKATPGWEFVVCDDHSVMVATAGDVICVPDPNIGVLDETVRRNFQFIACSRADIPWLLDQLTLAQSQAKEHAALMREAADMMSDVIPATAEGLITKLRDAADRAEGKI